MRILLMPCVGRPIPHLIPLLALASRLDPKRHDARFLLPQMLHGAVADLGYRVLDVDYQNGQAFKAEMQAYDAFRPDVVVDDLGLTALLSTTLSRVPRVTVRRTGVFPGATPRNGAHAHSCIGDYPHYFDRYPRLPLYRRCLEEHGVAPPTSLVELCAAHMNIVAGIRSVELLPETLACDPTYVFAGPLVIADEDCARLMRGADRGAADARVLTAFLDRQRSGAIVFVTMGTVLAATDAVRGAIRYMLARGAAVVSTVDLPDAGAAADRFFYAPTVPMHAVCARADLMVHHCGSGTYQYQIRHQLPAICIGSGYYDRDDVAIRLAELGVSHYVPSPDEARDFDNRFRDAFDAGADPVGRWTTEARRRLFLLRTEADRTAERFDLETVLDHAVSFAIH